MWNVGHHRYFSTLRIIPTFASSFFLVDQVNPDVTAQLHQSFAPTLTRDQADTHSRRNTHTQHGESGQAPARGDAA